MNTSQPRILIVDDDPKYINVLTAILKVSGHGILSAANGKTAVEIAKQEKPALVLLDVLMPDWNGYETCRRIREFLPTPIIMITAMSQKSDVVRGLEAGADDYLTKPFSTDELLARVQVALRRAKYSGTSLGTAPFLSENLCVDYGHNQVFVDGKEIYLTHTEYRFLCELTRAEGQTVSIDDILKSVWGEGHEGENQLTRYARYVMEHLLVKIEGNTDSPRFIHIQPGSGYILEKRNAEPCVNLTI